MQQTCLACTEALLWDWQTEISSVCMRLSAQCREQLRRDGKCSGSWPYFPKSHHHGMPLAACLRGAHVCRKNQGWASSAATCGMTGLASPPVALYLTSGTAELACAASVSCSAVPCHPRCWVPRGVPVCPGSAWGPGSTGGQGLCLQLQLSE